MTLPEIGTLAPSFRLPGAAGTEVALGDYRGVKSVLLWFSKGLF
jgi:peroxiredoxin